MSSRNDDSASHEMALTAGILALMAIVAGYVIKFAFKHPIATAVIFITLYVGDLIDRKLFSPETRNMSSEISNAYKHVQLVSLTPLREDANKNSSYPAWYQDFNINRIQLVVHNDNPARVVGMTVACTGRTVLQPPDQSYAPETKDSAATSEFIAIDIPAGATKMIELKGWKSLVFPLVSQVENVRCSVTNASVDKGEFYRASGQVDRWGAARIKEDIVTTFSDRTTTYQGRNYPIAFSGSVINVSKKPITKIAFDCLYAYNTVLPDSETLGFTIDNIDLKPGATLDVKNHVETDYWRKPTAAECHVTEVW